MNETQYYSATGGGEKGIFFKTGTWWGDEMSYRNVVTQQGYPQSKLTDLTPVKFVSQDAVVIEGVTLEYLEDMADFGEQVCANNGFPNNARDFKKLRDYLRAQLTPPKPRPEEPKAIYPKVSAVCPCWSASITWTLGADGNWHTCRNGKWENHAWESLSDTVVISAGQVK